MLILLFEYLTVFSSDYITLLSSLMLRATLFFLSKYLVRAPKRQHFHVYSRREPPHDWRNSPSPPFFTLLRFRGKKEIRGANRFGNKFTIHKPGRWDMMIVSGVFLEGKNSYHVITRKEMETNWLADSIKAIKWEGKQSKVVPNTKWIKPLLADWLADWHPADHSFLFVLDWSNPP